MAALATDWQHQNRKRPDTANNANASKSGLTCGFVKFQSCQIIVRWLSGGGSASSNLAGGADVMRSQQLNLRTLFTGQCSAFKAKA
jgi:hypothetical protein